MKKKLIMAAAIAFAVFAIPYGSNALSTVAVASENNTIATPEPTTKPVDEVKDTISEIKADEIKTAGDTATVREKLYGIGSANLKNAMNSNPDIIAELAKIEAACRDAEPDNKTTLINSDEAAIEAVGVIGANFNSTDARLTVAPPSEEPHIDVAAYDVTSEPIYVEISLQSGESTVMHELNVPVAITIKRPAGVDGNKAVIFHYLYGTFEAIKPYYNAEDDTLTFAVDHFSTFAIAEAEESKNNGNNGNNSSNGSDDSKDTEDTVAAAVNTDSAFTLYRGEVVSEIENAQDGATVTITKDKNINALPNDFMQALYNKKTVTLVMEYTYEGKDYTVTIPAGKAENSDIAWYGPLYLQMHYGK